MSGLQEDLRVLRLSRWRTIGMRRTPAKVWTGPEFAAAGKKIDYFMFGKNPENNLSLSASLYHNH